MKNHYLFLGLALICLPSCHKSHDSDASERLTVDVAYPVQDSVLVYKTYPGTIAASQSADVVGRVNGTLLSKDYTSGAYVRKGQVLFRIEDQNYRDAVVQAEAALSTARATLEYAASHYKAMTEALKGDAVSEMEVSQAKSAYAQAQASVKNAEAALQSARTQLSYCTVRAPFDGHITTATLDPGAYVNGQGAPVVLATLYQDSQMVAVFAVEDDATLGELRRNIEKSDIDYHHIPVAFSEGSSRQYYADLYYQAPSVSTSTGTMTLKAIIDNPDGELKSGMYVTISLPVASDPHAILVRDASIASDQLGKYVYVVNDSNKVVYTPVKTGETVRDSLRIVTSGLSPRDRYVTKALMKVRDGMDVKPVVADSLPTQKR